MIPFRARKLNRRDGFLEEWRKLLKDGMPGPYAYEQLEKEYFDFFGYYRYSDYKSFYHTNHQAQYKKDANKTT